MSRRGSTQLLLLFFRSRKLLGWSVGTLAGALIVTGLMQAGGEFPLLTRTGLAQQLRQSAWEHALAGLPEQAAWPWAESSSGTTGVPPRLGLSATVLKDAGADEIENAMEPPQPASGQDPHLPQSKFSEVSVGDRITVTSADGTSRVYRVTGRRVVDPHLAENEPAADGDDPTLAACPRLDRTLADKLSLVIQATRVDPPAQPEHKPEQKL
jgi:hypothetical protein